MCEHDSILYCPTCRTRQAFNVSGSGRSATCFVCEKEITGTENIRYLTHVALLHYQESGKERTLGDFIFEDLEKGL